MTIVTASATTVITITAQNETIENPSLGEYSGNITELDLCKTIIERSEVGGFSAQTLLKCTIMTEEAERQEQEQRGNYTIRQKECEILKQSADLGGYELSLEKINECEKIRANEG